MMRLVMMKVVVVVEVAAATTTTIWWYLTTTMTLYIYFLQILSTANGAGGERGLTVLLSVGMGYARACANATTPLLKTVVCPVPEINRRFRCVWNSVVITVSSMRHEGEIILNRFPYQGHISRYGNWPNCHDKDKTVVFSLSRGFPYCQYCIFILPRPLFGVLTHQRYCGTIIMAMTPQISGI